MPRRLQLVVGEPRVAQVGEREIASEATLPWVKRLEVTQDGVNHRTFGQKRAGARYWWHGRRPGVDPLLEYGQIVLAGPRLLALRRHFTVRHTIEDFRVVSPTGDDLLAGHHHVAVQNVEESALGRPRLTVAARAMRSQDT